MASEKLVVDRVRALRYVRDGGFVHTGSETATEWVEDMYPRFGVPGPDTIPVHPAVLLAEACGECRGGSLQYAEAAWSGVGCPACSGRGHTGRVAARAGKTRRNDPNLFGAYLIDGRWSIAIAGAVMMEDSGEYVRDSQWVHIRPDNSHDLKSALENAGRRHTEESLDGLDVDVTFRALLLHENTLYVVGVAIVGELPEGADWIGPSEEDKGFRPELHLGPLSRALWPRQGELLNAQ